MYREILVPLDGSDEAEITLRYAVDLAAKFGAEIMLVSISEIIPNVQAALYRSYLKSTTEKVERDLERQKEKETTRVWSETLSGRPADEILRYADRKKADLIILASRGASGSGPWLLGSVAAKILRAASKPILLIRNSPRGVQTTKGELFKKLLVPLDGSELAESVLPDVQSIALSCKSQIVLLHVLETPVEQTPMWLKNPVDGYPVYYDITESKRERRKSLSQNYLNDVAKKLSLEGCVVSTEVSAVIGSSADKIIDYAQANSFDLIAMSTHGRSGLGRWVFGSTTDKVLHSGEIPVLVVRPGKT
jgi:nucleotide-binding universal stress UspA family protein